MKKSTLLSLLCGSALLTASASAAFPGAGGDYGGILEDTSGTNPDNSGILTVILRDSGASSVKITWQGQVYSFKAFFDENGSVTKEFKRKGGDEGTLSLLCVLNPDSRIIGGTFTDTTGNGTGAVNAGFTLSGAVPDPAVTAQLEPGTRVAFIEPQSTVTAAPQGTNSVRGGLGTVNEDGFTQVTVSKTSKRSSRFIGRLPDSTVYTTGSPLRGAKYALRAGIYSQKKEGSGGQVLGLSDVSTASGAQANSITRGNAGASIIASLRWHKKQNLKKDKAYPGGIDQNVELETVAYTKNRDPGIVLTGEAKKTVSMRMRFTNGNLVDPNPFFVNVNVGFFKATVVGDNPNKVKVKVNPLLGKFNGKFTHPETGESIKFDGSLRSTFGGTPGEGRGNFLSRGSGDRNPEDARAGSVRMGIPVQ